MDFQARGKKTPETRRKELFDLYIRRHNRLNSWDLVDRSAPHVVGGYLFDKPRKILYKLARSKHMAERRTAIVSTLYFIGQLEKVEWNNFRLIKDNVAEEISQLKQQPGQDIVIHGSGTLVHTLLPHNLIDEHRLLVFPVVLGSGQRLFRDGSQAALKLVETRSFSSGVVLLRYQPAAGE